MIDRDAAFHAKKVEQTDASSISGTVQVELDALD